MSDEKSFSVCQEMLPLFRAVLKTKVQESIMRELLFTNDEALVGGGSSLQNLGGHGLGIRERKRGPGGEAPSKFFLTVPSLS